MVKFIFSEKVTKFCEIFPLLLTTVHTVKSKGKISQTLWPSQNIWTLKTILTKLKQTVTFFKSQNRGNSCFLFLELVVRSGEQQDTYKLIIVLKTRYLCPYRCWKLSSAWRWSWFWNGFGVENKIYRSCKNWVTAYRL